jgi:hypothetical protein
VGNDAQLWWQCEDEASRAASVVATVDALERDQGERRARALRNVSIYEGRKLEGLFPSAYFTSVEMTGEQCDVRRLRLARSLVNTAFAKVAGKQKPKAQFMTTDADWTTKRKAKRLERVVEAVWSQRQGNARDGWEVARLAFRDCEVTDMGVLKFWTDLQERKIVIDRVLPWELITDPQESRYGMPQNWFHVYAYDRYKLAARFPDDREAIMSAPGLNEETTGANAYGTGGEIARMVKVREAYRLAFSKDEPGMHSIIVGGADLAKGEKYERMFPPFECMSWEPWMMGLGGTSLVDNVAEIDDELNASVERRSQAEKLNSNGVGYYREGSIDSKDLEDNRVGIWVSVKQGFELPTYHAPETTSQGSIQWASQLQQWGHDISGVSSMAATGQTDQGVTAGIAMRTQENISSERFAIPWQTFENLVAIGGSRQIIACMRELAEDDPGAAVKWPGGSFLKDIRWSEADLEDDQFHIQVAAVSGLVNTPADRLQLASELYDRGILSQDSFLRVIQAKDIDAELERTNTQYQLIDRYIEDWLEVTPETVDDGTFRYRPPIKWMQLPEAIVQVGRAYLAADLDDAPEFNLDFFLRWMGDADAKVQELEATRRAADEAAKAQQQAMQQQAAPTPGAMPPQAQPRPPSAAMQPNGAMQ